MSIEDSARVTLHQFSSSHYNEKARWVLTYKQVAHERISYLPGPHIRAMKKLSNQSSTPVLDWHGQIVPGSDEIVRHVDKEIGDHPLFPTESTALKAVTDWCTRLDDELGPAVRTLVWSSMINHSRYAIAVFGKGQSGIKLAFYRFVFPLLKPLIAKANGVNPENIKHSEVIVAQYLDEVAEAAAETGYLVGDSFTAADLTAAALMGPLAKLDHRDIKKPEPILPSLNVILDRYAEHPAINWVQTQYQRHRG